jgi:pimeloyl-ACP methyl ester carboxylesterase
LDVADALKHAQSEPIHSTGPLLSTPILQAAAAGNSLLLVEGVKKTNESVILRIERISDNKQVAEIPFHLSVSGVEEMFRHKKMRMDAATTEPIKETIHPPASDRFGEPANLPDDYCNEDWLVFLHGYNVNGRGARGWHAEAFKRLFWSGNKGRFVGISWYGDQTQLLPIGVTPKYYENVENALNTAEFLSEFVNGLGDGKKFVASHSLGGLVVASAIANEGMDVEKAFLIDPALPTEALLPESAILNDIHMEPSSWRDYPEEIKASEWSLRFPETDARSTLKWRGLLNPAVPKLKMFFSEGEEVLGALPPNIPADPGWAGDNPRGQYAFAIQAMLKGELGNEPKASQESFAGNLTSILASAWEGFSPATEHGGWKWTLGAVHPLYGIPDSEGNIDRMPPITFATWLDDPAFSIRLRTDPVFGLGVPADCTDLFHPTNGHNIAEVDAKARRILAQMIPERTLPAGGAGGSGVAGQIASLQEKFAEAEAGDIEVFDMQANRNGWPQEREDPVPGNGWRHGDVKDVAYTYVWKTWEEIITDSGLDRYP